MNKLLKNTRNTLSISYTVDKTSQVGKFLLKLLKDNLPVKVDSGARILVSRKEDGAQFEWKDPVYDDGQIFLDAQNFDGIKQAGTYFLRVILKNGEIFPSSGKCILKLQKDLKAEPGEFQIIQGINGKDGKTQSLADIKILVKDAISEIPLIKGDKGDKGDPGSKGDTGKGIKNVKYNDGDLFIYYTDGSNDAVSLPLLKGDTGKAGLGIKNITLVGNTLSVVMDDGTSHQLALPLLKGDPGEKGQDGANVSEITISGNTLFFHYTDGLTYSAQLPLLKGDPGEKGQDAPKISDVSLNGNVLTFTLSDKSTYSTILPLLKGDTGKSGKSAYEIAEQYGFKGTVQEWLQSLKGIKGEKGEPGQNGKDAPTISNVKFSNNNSLIFNLSDGSKQSVTIPTIQGPAGENGQPGKDAAKITGAKFNADQTQIIFSLSDGTSFTTNFIPPKNGTNGTNGKDAANFTNVTYSNNSLIFTLSDGKNITAALPDLKGKDGVNGKDGAPGKDAPTITGAKVENNKLTFTFSDGTSQSADLPNLEGKSITDIKLNGTILIFTLSDNSKFGVNLGSITKTNFDTYADAGTQILQNPSSSLKPTDGSVNAIISPTTPTLLLNYKNNPLKLTYDKNYKTLSLTTDTTGNLQSYKIDFSPIFDMISRMDQQKLSNIYFIEKPKKLVLKPNTDENYLDIDFDINKYINGQIIKDSMHNRLTIDTTQLTSNSSGKKTIDLFTGGNFNYRENPNLNTSYISKSIKVVIVKNIYFYNQNGSHFISCDLSQNDFKFADQTIYNSGLDYHFDNNFSFGETYLGPDISFSIPAGFDVIVDNNRLVLNYRNSISIDKIPVYPSILPGPYELRFNK